MRWIIALGLGLGTTFSFLAPATAQTPYGVDTGAITINVSTVDPGGTLSFTIPPGTFMPNSPGEVFLLSEPVKVGAFTVDADGGGAGSVTIPADAAAGNHTLEFRGTGPDGQPKVLGVALSVSGERLAGTGASNTGSVLRVAGLVLVVGLVLLAVAAQRRRAREAAGAQTRA